MKISRRQINKHILNKKPLVAVGALYLISFVV